MFHFVSAWLVCQHNRKIIFKFAFENLSFEIADEYQSVISSCFAAVAINRSRAFTRVPHDDCDIVVIYMKSTENQEQVTR